MSDSSATTPLVQPVGRRHDQRPPRCGCTKARKQRICVVVFLSFVGIAAISIGAVEWKVKASEVQTAHLTDMTRNSTWAVHFSGRHVDTVTLEVSSVDYGPFMDLYSFPRLPPLDVHQEYHQIVQWELIPNCTFYYKKFFLNAGSHMNVSFSFCSKGSGLQVLVVQHDGHIDDLIKCNVPVTQENVKKNVLLPYNGHDCQNDTISFYCAESAAYHFVFQPWNHSGDLWLRDIEFNGNITQYSVETGATDYCNVSSEMTQCSVDLNRDAATVVVVGLGNVPFPPNSGIIFISCTLTPTSRKDFRRIIVGGVLGFVVVVALLVFVMYLGWSRYCRHGRVWSSNKLQVT